MNIHHSENLTSYVTAFVMCKKCCEHRLLYSPTHHFYQQLVAQSFFTYDTKFLHVSAICPGHIQGVTLLVDVYSIHGNLS